jgi:protein SCO1/2
MLLDRRMDENTPEEQFAGFVDAIKRSPESVHLLVELLQERNPVFRGRSSNATVRMRGYVMAAFEEVGMPEAALPYVIEELESGREAYLVAAAAKALRGSNLRGHRTIEFLLKAVENIRYNDDTVTFDRYRPSWPSPNHTTALAEIFRTMTWLGPTASSASPNLQAFEAQQAVLPAVTATALAEAMVSIKAEHCTDAESCCHDKTMPGPLEATSPHRHVMRDSDPPVRARFEDQNGRALTYSEVFVGRPTVVVFFYTRCNNPNKCSLTITKLAKVQNAIEANALGGLVRTAAITYDPDFDLPPRLTAYGQNRGVTFDDNHRFLRTTVGFKKLADYFELGVNYGHAAVNRHRIEAFVLDDKGQITATFERLQWEVSSVVTCVSEIVRPA